MGPNSLQTNGAAIRTLRKGRGLKLYELAREAGITDGYLGNIERGKANGSSWVLRRIASRLGVPLQAIVSEPLPDAVAA